MKTLNKTLIGLLILMPLIALSGERSPGERQGSSTSTGGSGSGEVPGTVAKPRVEVETDEFDAETDADGSYKTNYCAGSLDILDRASDNTLPLMLGGGSDGHKARNGQQLKEFKRARLNKIKTILYKGLWDAAANQIATDKRLTRYVSLTTRALERGLELYDALNPIVEEQDATTGLFTSTELLIAFMKHYYTFVTGTIIPLDEAYHTGWYMRYGCAGCTTARARPHQAFEEQFIRYAIKQVHWFLDKHTYWSSAAIGDPIDCHQPGKRYAHEHADRYQCIQYGSGTSKYSFKLMEKIVQFVREDLNDPIWTASLGCLKNETAALHQDLIDFNAGSSLYWEDPKIAEMMAFQRLIRLVDRLENETICRR